MTTLRERYPLELSAGRAMARAAKQIDDEFARLPGLTEQEQNQIRLVWRSDSWFAPDGTCDLFGGARTPQEAAAVVLKMRNRLAVSED
jgi:hypothetical protein